MTTSKLLLYDVIVVYYTLTKHECICINLIFLISLIRVLFYFGFDALDARITVSLVVLVEQMPFQSSSSID
jgi:hypothetical protein